MDLEKSEIQALKGMRNSIAYTLSDLQQILNDLDSLDHEELIDMLREIVHDYSNFKVTDRQNQTILGYLKILDNLKTRLQNKVIIPL